MGLPVELVCAVNENDIFHRALSTGDFTLSENVVPTWSTAMDIQVMAYTLITNHSRGPFLKSPCNLPGPISVRPGKLPRLSRNGPLAPRWQSSNFSFYQP